MRYLWLQYHRESYAVCLLLRMLPVRPNRVLVQLTEKVGSTSARAGKLSPGTRPISVQIIHYSCILPTIGSTLTSYPEPMHLMGNTD